MNFRDFGGMSSRFGGIVKRGLLYRGGALSGGADADAYAEHLLALDFALIVDLRYIGERHEDRMPWPAFYASRILFLDGGRDGEAPHMAPLRNGSINEALADQLYVQLYRDLPFDPFYRRLFARALNSLPDLEGRALIHCSAGKDRTGMLVALILYALGVPSNEILADYMMSAKASYLLELVPSLARAMEAKYGHCVRDELMVKLLGVEEHYLTAMLNEVETKCGSIDAYLDSAGLDANRRDLMRERFLSR
jgi:protein-tyrosine phosphatase